MKSEEIVSIVKGVIVTVGIVSVVHLFRSYQLSKRASS